MLMMLANKIASQLPVCLTWKFAHEHAGKLWWKMGVGLLGPTLLIHLPFYGASDDTMGIWSIIIIVIQLGCLIGSVFSTEKALKNKYRNT